jgi:hypothetical protein
VPQGSTMGPYLFTTPINSVCATIHFCNFILPYDLKLFNTSIKMLHEDCKLP